MDDWSSRLTTDDKLRLTAGRDMWSTFALSDPVLNSMRMADGPMGITGGRVDERDVALLSPCGLALAASWDPQMVRHVGQVIGDEALRMGVQAVLAPNLNLMRSPLAGRAFELFGEDPLLIAQLGSAWAQGVQSRGVAAVIKHVVCNDSETDRRSLNVVVDENTLHDVYFQPFSHCARQGAWAMLTGYNRVNGVACSEHAQVIGAWLKAGLGWDGLVMSDWFGTQDGVSSLNAGLDLEMPGPARHMGEALLSQPEGSIDPARIDDAADRLAWLARRVSTPVAYAPDPLSQAQRVQVLEDSAAAGMVLLRNSDNCLPLTTTAGRTIAVIGPNAQQPCFQGGTFAKVALTPDVLLPVAAITERFARDDVQVLVATGVDAQYRIPPLNAFDLLSDEASDWLEVTFHDTPGGAAIHREVRHASSLIWFKDMPGVGNLLALQKPAQVRVRSRFVAPVTGDYRFYFGGTGSVSLILNGQVRGHFDGVSLGADIMGKLMQAPHGTIEQRLEEGQSVSLEFDMQIERSLAHGVWFGCKPPRPSNLLQQALAIAEQADQVVLIVGETADAGLESVDRDTTHLPDEQIELIERVCALNPNTVIVLNVAHPLDTRCMHQAKAILLAWYPGQQFGPALAAVLAGDKEPGGRLPVTFARQQTDYPVWSLTPQADGNLSYDEGWWVGYRSFMADGIAPAFALGHGLGYARFEWDTHAVEGRTTQALQVKVGVRNISQRAGKDVVQAYLKGPSDPVAGRARVQLCGFKADQVPAGGYQPFVMSLNPDSFLKWCPLAQQSQIVAGDYQLWIGQASDKIRWCIELQVATTGEVRVL